MLVATYRLLAFVARDVDGPLRVGAWERPWIRTLIQTETGRARRVRLPAAAALIHEQPRSLLLLPDLGTIPVASYRPVLHRLLALRQTPDADEQHDPLLVVGVAAGAGSAARVAAWQSLLQQVARRAGEQPLHARVVPWKEALVARGNKNRRFGDQAEQALGLVARHPLLTRQQLATLVGVSETRAGRLVRWLTEDGWVRSIQSGNVPADAIGHRPGQPRRLALIELTPAGRREAGRRLLLSAGVATRYHGLLGNQTSTRRFLRHLAHTIGANAVFVAFASAARRGKERGSDEALEEWRSAAACARGRFRPDGYGCYRRDGSRFGFFLEYDRGTERPAEYASKLAAYYRYRDSTQSMRDYDGFPTLLVVTTSLAAEARFAYQAYLARQRRAAAPLLVFLTTTWRIQAHAKGLLGPIWCTPGPHPWGNGRMRVCWLPALGSRRLGPTPQATARTSSRWKPSTRDRGPTCALAAGAIGLLCCFHQTAWITFLPLME